MTLFSDIALIVVLASALGFLAHIFRQPTIVGYLAAGLLIGPLGYLQFNSMPVLDVFAEIGIALLLFMVGLEINPMNLKEVGKHSFYAGLAQVIITFGIGFFLMQSLGYGMLASAYVSFALTFSSTIIVVQLLSQKRDLGSLYGKIAIGVLLLQDFVAILALIFLSGLSKIDAHASLLVSSSAFLITLLKGAVLLWGTMLLSRKIFPRLLDFLGRSQEVLFLFSMAWGLGLAALMATPWVGFSIEIGAFLAGLALANSFTHFQIAGRVKPIRDFFIMLFFVALGAKLAVGDFEVVFVPALILSAFVLIIQPLIVMGIMSVIGYRSRTSFLVSLTMAQISEFSLILAGVGLRLGHISGPEASLITLVGIITITISSYFILHGDKLYSLMKRALKFFELIGKGRAEKVGEQLVYANHTVLIGAHRMGSNILAALRGIEEPFVVIDFDPAVVEDLAKRGVPVLYGDVNDEEIQILAGINRARAVISTIPNFKDNLTLIEFLGRENPQSIKILTAENEWEAKEFYKLKVDYVILPHFVGGLQIAQAIKADPEFNQLEKLRIHDLSMIGR